MKQFFWRFQQLIFGVLAALLLLFSLCFAILQTKWAKKEIYNLLVQTAQKQGIVLHLGEIEGRFPFLWIIKEADFIKDSSYSLHVEDAKLRFSFFPFFRKEIAVSYFSAKKAVLTLYQIDPVSASALNQKKINDFSPSWSLNIRSLKIPFFTVINKKKSLSSSFSIDLRGKLKRRLKEIFLDLQLVPLSAAGDKIDLYLKGSRRRKHMQGRLSCRLSSISFLKPLFPLDFETKGHLVINLDGPWTTFKEIFHPTFSSLTFTPLNAQVKANIDEFILPNCPLLNRNWKLDADASLFPTLRIQIQHFLTSSDLIQMKGQANISPSWRLEKGSCVALFPSLSLFAPYFGFELKGEMRAEMQYDEYLAGIKFSSPSLKIQNFVYENFYATLKAKRFEEQWKGNAELNASHPSLPLTGQLSFLLVPWERVQFDNFFVNGPDLRLNGALAVNFPHHTLDGSLFGHILHMQRIQDFFPRAYVEGSLGLEAVFSSKQKNTDSSYSQQANCHLLFKNVRYNQLFVDQATINIRFKELFHQPKGSVSLEAQRIYLPHLNFSNINFETHSEEEEWTYNFDLFGKWKDVFEVHSNGKWLYDEEHLRLAINDFNGLVLNKSFFLSEPLNVHYSPTALKCSHFKLNLGEGFFSASGEFTKETASATVEAEHFPIDFLSLPMPHFALSGTTSIHSFLIATPENMRAQFNLILEHADVLSFQKKNPFQGKGVLQAHLNKENIQIHSHFVATNEQFFDWTGTFPIDYELYPFRIHLNKERPVSSELTMEGKLEEIFDFVNFGVHRASGLLSTHLIMSKNLSSPALNGEIEVQEGTYENDFTGTFLKGINARLEAQKDQIDILRLEAKDNEKGSATATGRLTLSPQDHFPYFIEAELSNLNVLRFDMMESNFTGPIKITGSAQEALAKGSVEVSQANLKIPDELPTEIPTLPVTFIHQPAHLKANSMPLSSVFPLHLDLDLHADDHIFVKGKGLDCEWKGNVHVTGTNMLLAINGLLTLLKGEFNFSGKTFTLTQGEISFTDKPTQSSYLSLSGTTSLPNATVTAFLRGPLTAPQLTFQSNPPMSTSSILSLILFNKDISEISAFQAVQLAQAIISLSGGAGPSVLEKIRKSLGVDRLNIIFDPTREDQISIQIGKYLTKGVMITLTQSSGSSQVVVEVELAKGFVLQAETQEEEEGKFSLKWNCNY